MSKKDIKIAVSKKPIVNRYLYIIDKSGSMASVRDVTRNGLNEQIQRLKKLEKENPDQKYFGSIISFDDKVQTVIQNASPDKMEELKVDDYIPGGTTAMYSAIRHGIDMIKQDAKDLVDDSVNATVSVVILTDGQENASSYEDRKAVPGLIKELEATDKWVFSLIGANIDIKAEAAKLNLNASNTIAYSSDSLGTCRAFSSLAESTDRYAMRKARGISTKVSYFEDTDEDKKALQDNNK